MKTFADMPQQHLLYNMERQTKDTMNGSPICVIDLPPKIGKPTTKVYDCCPSSPPMLRDEHSLDIPLSLTMNVTPLSTDSGSPRNSYRSTGMHRSRFRGGGSGSGGYDEKGGDTSSEGTALTSCSSLDFASFNFSALDIQDDDVLLVTSPSPQPTRPKRRTRHVRRKQVIGSVEDLQDMVAESKKRRRHRNQAMSAQDFQSILQHLPESDLLP